MRGRAAVPITLLLLLVFAFPAYPACSWTPRYSGQFRTTAFDISIDGDFIWLATGYGVKLLEQKAGGTPALLASVGIPGSTRVVRTDGSGLAYVGSGSRVYVLRRNGNQLRVIRSVSASGTVQDILITSYLFVATSNGIDHFDRVDPENPFKTSVVLPTSSPSVTSLALSRSTVYAADGDTTLERFSISIPSIPQNTGSLDTLRATSVHATADGQILASDRFGLSTDLFSGTTRLARYAVGATSFAGSATAQFVAGPDRTLRAIDFSEPARLAELFEFQLAPTDGSDNAIHAMRRSGNTLYVAAGDIGLVMFDVASMARPYPMISYFGGATTSVRAAGDKAWFSNAGGTISEQRIVASGLALTEERTWSAGAGAVVRDVSGQTLLTTLGSTATFWALGASSPTSSGTVTFAAAINNAVLRDTGVVALLADGSVWTAQPGGTPVKASLPKMALLARSGTGIAFAEVNESTGKTTVHYFASGDFATAPRLGTFNGSPVGSMGLDATRAAVFTFGGINLVDLASGSTTIVPGSTRLIPRFLALSGGDLLASDGQRLAVYDDGTTLVRELQLPSTATAFDSVTSIAVMATADGTAAATHFGQQPPLFAPFSSSFYKDIAAGPETVYLLTGDGIDVFRTASNSGLQFINSLEASGIIGLASTGTNLYTLSGSGRVTRYSDGGTALGQMDIQEGEDAQPRGITVAGNAVWVSLTKGCSTGTCEKKTIVIDPVSLVVTSSLTGGVDDLVFSGGLAYALTDLPAEVRVVSISDPLHPTVLRSTTRPPSGRSIAAASGRVYVLGEKVFAFLESTLAADGEHLPAVTANDSLHIRIEGDCAIISGRGDHAETYTLPQFTSAGALVEMPSPVRSFVLQPGRVLLLTTHSLELWASSAADRPGKRRAR